MVSFCNAVSIYIRYDSYTIFHGLRNRWRQFQVKVVGTVGAKSYCFFLLHPLDSRKKKWSWNRYVRKDIVKLIRLLKFILQKLKKWHWTWASGGAPPLHSDIIQNVLLQEAKTVLNKVEINTTTKKYNIAKTFRQKLSWHVRCIDVNLALRRLHFTIFNFATCQLWAREKPQMGFKTKTWQKHSNYVSYSAFGVIRRFQSLNSGRGRLDIYVLQLVKGLRCVNVFFPRLRWKA